MHRWINALNDHQARGLPCVLVSLLDTEGTLAGLRDYKILVSAEGVFDSLGSADLDDAARHLATALLAEPAGTPQRHALPAGNANAADLVLVCEYQHAIRADVSVFGAGPVAQALVPLLAALPCRVRWIATGKDPLPADLPSGVLGVTPARPLDEIAELPTGSYCLLLTRDHDLDFQLAEAALQRADFTWLGMIGSRTKRARFDTRLRAQGMDDAALRRVRCPVGLAQVPGTLPMEIAVAIAAEVIATYNAAPTRPASTPDPTT